MSEPTTESTTTAPETSIAMPDDGLFGAPGEGIEMSSVEDFGAETVEDTSGELTGFDISEEDSNGLRNEEGQEETETSREVIDTVEDSKNVRMIQLGDSEYEADMEVQINGQAVPLGSLVDDYIGQKEINRRFTEFDKQKKTWENDVVARFNKNEQLVLNEIKKLQDAADAGEYSGAIASLAKMAGANPVEFERQIIKHVMESADGVANMTEAEEKAYWAEKEAAHAKSQLEEREDVDREATRRAEVKKGLQDIIYASGLSERQFEEAYSHIRQNEQAMKVIRELTPEKATQAVCTFYLDSAKEERIAQAIEAVAPNYDDKENLINNIFTVADYDYSVNDIKEVLREYLGLDKEPVQASETPSKTPTNQGKSERAASAISEISNLEPEDAIGWDFT